MRRPHGVPDDTRNGSSGTNAPSENVTNDEPAAANGDPRPSRGSSPSSSRAWVSSATSGSFMSSVASRSERSLGRPLRT